MFGRLILLRKKMVRKKKGRMRWKIFPKAKKINITFMFVNLFVIILNPPNIY